MTRQLEQNKINDLIEYAYLNLGDISTFDLTGPFTSTIFDDVDEFSPPELLFDVMLNPKYLGWVCRNILNVETGPFQDAILYEVWTHPFPMLIGSRGLSKSFLLSVYSLLRALLIPNSKIVIVGGAFRQSKFLFEYITNIWRNAPILRDICGDDARQGPHIEPDKCTMVIGNSSIVTIPIGDGCLSGNTLITQQDGIKYINYNHDINNINKNIINRKMNIYGNGQFNESDESYCNGLQDTKIITTKKGYQIEGTLNHKLKVCRNRQIVWSRLDEMQNGDKLLIDLNKRWFNDTNNVTEEEAYSLGLMIGDGNYTNKYHLGFATQDEEFIQSLNIGMNETWLQSSDKVHWKLFGKNKVSNWLQYWGMSLTYTIDKKLPNKLLSASKKSVAACLSGLFDTDGHLLVTTKDGGTGITVAFTNTSKNLVYQIQYILTHFGICSSISSRIRQGKKWNRSYELRITGKDVQIFADEIGFKLTRKKQALERAIANKKRWPKRNNDFGTYYLDEIVNIENSKTVTYDVHIPIIHEYGANGFYSHNTKIRGLRSTCTIVDEFASLPRLILENVITGFGAVTSNPVQSMKRVASIKKMKELGIPIQHLEEETKSNQLIISGTAFYSFNHFCEYWEQYKRIILSRGDTRKLGEVFKEGVPNSFNWKDYCIIRIPYELIPEGFMDAKQVDRAKATLTSSAYLCEFGAVFPKDSDGFYKRSLLELCTCKDGEPFHLHSGDVYFSPSIKGDINKKYVYAIDPASEKDNFSIVILEIYEDHRRIKYVWTTTRTEYRNLMKQGLTKKDEFYGFCVRKIRDLMQIFPCMAIALDTQGGGVAVEEALHSESHILPGEQAIWPVIIPDKEQETDDKSGLHILHRIQFANADWTRDANHGMKFDFEQQKLLFPEFDTISIGLAIEEDKRTKRVTDTLEDCVLEIEELKNELSTIVHTQTTTGRDKWDTPEVKLPGGKKGRQRKDRYSSLLMANMIARQISMQEKPKEYNFAGNFAGQAGTDKTGPLFTGPEWYTNQAKGLFG